MKTFAWTVLPFPQASSAESRRALRKKFLSALRGCGSSVIVDFSGCHSLNQEDIDLLLEGIAQVAGRDMQVVLVAGPGVIRVLLEVTRISSLVPVYDSVEEAIGYPRIAAVSGDNDGSASQSQSVGSA